MSQANTKYTINHNHKGRHRFFFLIYFLWMLCGLLNAARQELPPQAKAFARFAEDVQLPAGAAIRFDSDTYQQLQGQRRIRWTKFPLRRGRMIDLDLEPFEITTPTTTIVAGTHEGDIPLPHPEVLLLRGKVVGEEDSEVVLGISPYGNNGYIRRKNTLHFLSAGDRRNKKGPNSYHTIAEQVEVTSPITPAEEFQCNAKLLSEMDISADEYSFPCMTDTSPPPSSYDWRVAYVAIECDNEYLDHFGGDVGAALSYVLQLAGTSSHFFERDIYIKWNLSYIRIWTSTDPYTSLDGETTFNQYVYYWQVNMDHVERDLALMFSCKPGRWGYSLCPTLGDDNWAYTINYDLQGWFPRPVQDLNADNWDLHVVPHEAGHVFGSHHTHCYNPSIDNCPPEGADGDNKFCQDRTVFDECVPGTIMSYCGGANCGGYSNELMSFHPRVVRCIRDYVDLIGGLQTGLNPVYADWRNTGTEDGSISHPFNTIEEALSRVIPNGVVSIYAGTYPENQVQSPQHLTISRPVILVASGGTVTIGQ